MLSNFNGLPTHSTPTSSGIFTCISCRIKFHSAELQRMHMKTEWHRYNLKRRVAELPPISSEMFEIKVLQQKAKQEQLDEFGFRKLQPRARKPARRSHRVRPARIAVSQRYTSPTMSVSSETSTFTLGSTESEEMSSSVYDIDSALSEDQTSGTERYFSSGGEESDEENAAETEGDSDENGTDREEIQPHSIPVTVCFYCGRESGGVEDNIRHMFKNHGLYIPERSYLVDVDGLLRYLSDMVVVRLECIKCGFVGKTLQSIRQHVAEKGHCVVPYETSEDRSAVRPFYNFDSTLETHSADSNAKSVEFGGDQVINEPGSDSNSATDATEYTIAEIDSTGAEMRLPNGVCLGNRRYARYYRQNITRPEDIEVPESERTVATVYAKANEINQIGQRLKRQELKEIGLIEARKNSKALSLKLKKGNSFKYARKEII